ncbi:MAG: hypothetical protein AB8U25_03855 [Rickettsiales endosymbiont of Dermacentor nuttalli]
MHSLEYVSNGLAQNTTLEGQNSEGLAFSANFLPGFTKYQTILKMTNYIFQYLSLVDLYLALLGIY